jgi:hypothetical protein
MDGTTRLTVTQMLDEPVRDGRGLTAMDTKRYYRHFIANNKIGSVNHNITETTHQR